MDGDDGLMLNFAASSSTKPQQQHKGKRSAPSQQPAASSSSSKRSKVESGSSAPIKKAPRPSNDGRQTHGPSSSASSSRAKPTTFISSLFSKVPQADTLQTDEDAEEERRARNKAKPTNAPGSDASTFSGLGLDPLLVAHLESKRMSIGSRPTGIQRAALPTLLQDDDSRDALVHAQTGSGKTLTYLLPIIQSLLPLCTETWIDRSVGTLAIILAPTRELARQIYEVAEKLCQLHLSLREQAEEDGDEASAARRTRWLVPGLLSGGSTKNHEKSRLRKGIPLLVATPGRLLDHLQNTSSFDVGKCRWLVLDEADRLLEMGFKETLEGILKAMDGRRRLACNTAMEAMQETMGSDARIAYEDVEDGTGVKWWAKPRKVVLCSATLDENVQTLAGTHLRRPQVLRGSGEMPDTAPATEQADPATSANGIDPGSSLYPRLAAPAQLRQNAVVVPPKLRLVTLIALLRSALSRNSSVVNADARRVIVFVSCTDSVEFLWHALGGVKMGEDDEAGGDDGDENSDNEEEKASKGKPKIAKECELFPSTPIYRLHGSLPQSDRIASLKGFSAGMGKKTKTPSSSSNDGAILLCTSVAARGLDLPSVGCVIQLDPPTEGGVDEYLHRIGRTARVGKEGESWIMFLPHEREARERLEGAMQQDDKAAAKSSSVISEVGADYILKRGFGGRGDEYESRATEVQLAFERWVLRTSTSSPTSAATLARKAFLSHIRAYATHPSNEKDLFHVRFLHLGHLAKSFALREAPEVIKSNARKEAAKGAAAAVAANRDRRVKPDKKERLEARAGKANGTAATDGKADGVDDDDEDADLPRTAIKADIPSRSSRGAKDNILEDVSRGSKNADAEARMYAKVRALGKQSKKGGMLGSYGADEFQIA
ncbi:DEAD-domain-containing protein [Jaminaea rosea]|uniref:ATP-dependent RNA helicase n=1 Tax=Jaminaea rosea TaxID=1569628 RepID=A0A316UWP9_9BASI|nr:DEAD-domain-containing protein [Jaminaea rosea]PWN29709.1 DEAD-domain-containing protein [Jaminaea rosea]